jgi:hypothetical protein
MLRDDGTGHAVWIDRHVCALRPGRPTPAQRADQLSPDRRKPVPGPYGAELITKKGVFGIVGSQSKTVARAQVR